MVCRGSSNTGVVKEPFVGPVMELFHENEVEDIENEDEVEASPESLTVSSGSSRSSRESGVESMVELETGPDQGGPGGGQDPDQGQDPGQGQDKGQGQGQGQDLPDVTITEAGAEQDYFRSSPDPGPKTESGNNDIDSPFEKFNTVYV